MKTKLIKVISLSVLIVGVTLVILRTLAEPYRVSGDCMEPAFKDGNRYFLNRITPYLRSYKINDVVLFNYEGKTWISRIVALEGNTIQIVKDSVIVNGVKLKDGGVIRNWTDWEYGTYGITNPFQVPSGHVYVLSDNLSAHHDDSRVFGPVSHASILGVIW